MFRVMHTTYLYMLCTERMYFSMSGGLLRETVALDTTTPLFSKILDSGSLDVQEYTAFRNSAASSRVPYLARVPCIQYVHHATPTVPRRCQARAHTSDL